MASSTLRSRNTASSKQDGPSTPSNTGADLSATLTSKEDKARLSALDILRIIAGLLLLSSSLSYFIIGDSILWGYRPPLTRPARLKAWLRGPLLLTDTELSAYNGTNPSLPIYLAINGSIYDVSVSPHFYGPGGGYSFFAGRDATRAYVTGCFEEDLTPDLRGVEEMFMPVDDEGVGGGVGGVGGEEKEEKRERKLRLERERRVARKKVAEAVRGWEKMFDGGKDGKYFRVGRVKREEGWEEKLGPTKELCQKAKEGRPKRGVQEDGMG